MLRPCGHLGYVPLNIVYILVTKSVMTITKVHVTQLYKFSLSPFVDNQTNASLTLPPPSLTSPTPPQHALNMKSTCHLEKFVSVLVSHVHFTSINHLL